MRDDVPDLATRPHWSPALVAELARAGSNGRVGSDLVSETDRYRVWLIRLAPGERLPFHTHVLDYFWTATAPGRARSRNASGDVSEIDYAVGDTKHMAFGPGLSMIHDLENVGDTVLTFATVEDKRGSNAPLPL